MSPRFYFDANVIGVARVLEVEHPGITYPGHDDWPFDQDEDDAVWLQYIADAGWCAILRDKKIRYRHAEKEALVRHRARAVVIATKTNLTIDENAELIRQFWDDIEATFEVSPAYYHLTKTGLALKLSYS